MGRAPCCEKVGLKKGRWTAEEDEILTRYIQENGEGSWRSLPKKAGLLRCGKSCRLRWINYLKADLKRGNFSAEEEDIIIKLHGLYGNRWSLMAGHLPGRTDNEIKNYWNSHLSRRIHCFTRINKDGVPLPVVMDIGRIVCGCKRRRGRTSRSAMKKNLNSMEMRREKQHVKGVTHTLPLLDEEAQRCIICQNEERESKDLGPYKDHGVALGANAEGENGIMGFDKGIEDGFLCFDEGIDSPGEERESGAGLGANKKRESEVMGASKERGERESEGKGDEWCSSVASWFDELGCLQEEWMNWEWDELEDKMEEDEGERWKWLWESSNRDGDFLGMKEFEHENFAAWLMSADTDVPADTDVL